MSDLPSRLKVLEKVLLDLAERRDLDDDCMLLTQLDGFVAGILVCPDLIMPGEWLPMVWGDDDEDAAPAFDDLRRLEAFIKLVMEHYNITIGTLSAGRYEPLFDYDPRHDETLWELWMSGFERAMELRPDSWASFKSSDEAGRGALAGLIVLADVANRESRLPEAEIDRLTEAAPDLIAEWVETLFARRPLPPPGGGIAAPVRKSGKVGRNDPCPCGSGRKFKMCCGRN